MSRPIPWIVGNWKMNGLTASLGEAMTIADMAPAGVQVALCPPATLLTRMAMALSESGVAVGGQDCSPEPSGAFTGDIAARMLADAGAKVVIVGHSERRAGHGESDALVAAKVEAALAAGLAPIVCVGETLAEREAGETEVVVSRQVLGSLPAALAGQSFAVAYEPVWAIGTGLTATIDQIEAVHRKIRALLVQLFGEAGNGVPILYGGSVKPSNAEAILAADEVGGALVGGASLTAADFLPIVAAALTGLSAEPA